MASVLRGRSPEAEKNLMNESVIINGYLPLGGDKKPRITKVSSSTTSDLRFAKDDVLVQALEDPKDALGFSISPKASPR
jgi:hypothetical protein